MLTHEQHRELRVRGLKLCPAPNHDLVGHHAPLTRWRVSPCRASILRPRVAWGVARTRDRADRCPLPRLSPGREWRTRNRRERRSSRRQGTGDRRAPSRRTPVGLRRGLPDRYPVYLLGALGDQDGERGSDRPATAWTVLPCDRLE